MRRYLSAFLFALIVFSSTTPMVAQSPAPKKKPVPLTRFLWQDASTLKVHYADLLNTSPVSLSPVSTVDGFPALDPTRQTLVQMDSSHGYILVGVRDDSDGTFQSGWVLIDTGVDEEPHGDHSHWYFRRAPKVRAAVLDDKQGNPAHLYVYDGIFYLANDRLNGFTRLDPKAIRPASTAEEITRLAGFHQGGGGHITLAASPTGTAYATWIDRDGPNKGRVDMTRLDPKGNQKLLASFSLSSGGIHGATYCAGKAFFAPTIGIEWVSCTSSETTPKVNHLDLGNDAAHEDRPRRTGAFTTYQDRYVAFTSGNAESTRLDVIDASQPTLKVHSLDLGLTQEEHASGVELIRYRNSPYGFIFFDREHKDEAATTDTSRLAVLKLDPNSDGQWNDMQVYKTFPVGKSRVEGHGGHHNIAFDRTRRYAAFPNPGDGTLTLFSIENMSPLFTVPASTNPEKLLAVP